MDRKSFKDKLGGVTGNRWFGRIAWMGVIGLVALGVGKYAGKHGKNLAPAHLWETYSHAWESVQHKVDALKTSELENERLRLENAHLRLKLESLQFAHGAHGAAESTKKIQYKLDKETGSAVGRDLASIAYRIPDNLVPSQVHTLGVSYFKAREDEKAAVIFTFLTGMDDDQTFKTPNNHLMAGVSWYRLDNLALADRYFDRVLRVPASEENLKAQAQARLWKGLVAARLGKNAKAQYWLTELLDHHPRSEEASWVNRMEKKRSVASEKHH